MATSRSVDGSVIVGSDSVTLNGGTATFASEAVGPGRPVTLLGATLGGTDASKYRLTSVSTASADITAKGLTVDGAVAKSKSYDGNTDAGLDFTGATLHAGVVTGDVVTIKSNAAEGEFDNAKVGTGKSVTVTGVDLAGAAAGNYTVAQPTGLPPTSPLRV